MSPGGASSFAFRDKRRRQCLQSRSEALTGTIGARRLWTVSMISALSMLAEWGWWARLLGLWLSGSVGAVGGGRRRWVGWLGVGVTAVGAIRA
jgi:hypothetical protein